MKVSDKLFQLIKSLTKAEKRYFKLFASIYAGRKNYLRLFDAIDAQDVYDEDRLRELFVSERSLQVTKSYLYDQILRSLRVFHGDATVRAQIRELVQNIEILYEKGLLEQAFKMYEAALALATEHEELAAKIQILGWGTRLDTNPISSIDGAHRAYNPIYEALDCFRNYLDHLGATVKLTVPTLHDTPRTADDLDAIEHAMALFPGADASLSVKAKILYYWAHASYHCFRGEHEESLRFTELQAAIQEENPAMIRVMPVSYLQAKTNQLAYLKRLGRIDEFWAVADATLARGRELLAMNQLWSPRLRAQLFTSVYINQLLFHLEMKDRSRYAELARALEEGLAEHTPCMKTLDVLWLRNHLTRLHFEMGNLDAALQWNNSIVQDDLPEVGRRVYYHARLLKLLLHYEMGHTDLLDYLVVSTYRYFRSRNIVHGFEEAVLDFFRGVLRLKGGRLPLLELFESLRARLAALADDPLEAEAFDSFNYVDWLDHKIASLKGRSRRDGPDGASRIAA